LGGLDRRRADTGVHGDAEVADHPAQQCPACLIQLLGHQPRRHLDDMRRQAEGTQRVGGFQAQQATTDHDSDRSPAGVNGTLRAGTDCIEVIEGAVDVAARQIVAGHRRHERV
jgi:hypothetical protein